MEREKDWGDDKERYFSKLVTIIMESVSQDHRQGLNQTSMILGMEKVDITIYSLKLKFKAAGISYNFQAGTLIFS